KSWFYTNTAEYGSPEHDVREDPIASTKLSDDGLTLSVKLKGFGLVVVKTNFVFSRSSSRAGIEIRTEQKANVL
ncbi:MAG: hypothetical protein HOH94_04800, partial [Verrucomicrobia bacterium]|nr:hypothetical protein [Verrucomicrobiota bacterium]